MKLSGNPAQKHRMTAKEWLLVFLLALVIHILLFSIFVPMPSSFAESSGDRPFTFFMDEQKMDLRRHDPYGLQYWLRYSDPERLLKPDPETGFSMFQGRNELTIPEPDKIPLHLYESVSFYREPVRPLPAERTISDFCSGTDMPVIPPLPDRINSSDAQYPLWTDETGSISEGLFQADDKSLQILKQQHASAPSILRLTLRKDRIPAVLLLRSCGNPKLDSLAVRQLKLRKANFQQLNSSEPCVKYYTVYWQMPDLKSITKGALP